MEKLSLAEETLGYQTVQDPTNTDQRYLIGPSKNVLIDQNKKVRSRPGYTRLGSGSATLAAPFGGKTWNTSRGPDLPFRFYDDGWHVYFGTVDGTDIDDWKIIKTGLNTTNKKRVDFWYDDDESIDLALMVQGDAHIYEWNGAIAIVASVSTTAGAVITAVKGSSGGSGYAVGDVLTITGGGGTGATVEVLTISGSAVATVKILTLGTGYSDTSNCATTTTGSGTSAVITITTVNYTITKDGTTTWGENRFYTARNRTVVCLRTGTEYTYTVGVASTTINSATDPSTLVAGDILVQKVVDNTIAAPADRNAHTIFQFQNQIFLGSEDDENVFASSNTDFNDYTLVSPRIAGSPGFFTLTDSIRGFGQIGDDVIMFCGPSAAFKTVYKEIALGTTLAESLTALPIKSIGAQQGALNHESIVSIGNALAYLTNEVALRTLEATEIGGELQLHALSNPIKPDFDVEDWTNASSIWYKNALNIAAPANSHVYILEYVEDANGKISRFWQPPQTLPVNSWAIIDEILHGHSNSVAETYVMYDGLSDYIADGEMGNPDDKVSIDAAAYFAYRTFGKRGLLKCFDEYFDEGEINAATSDLKMTLNYDYGGRSQTLERFIDGTDEEILQGVVGHNSLAQASLGSQSLSGLLQPPVDARKFNVNFEIAKDDFMMLQPVFSTNDTDRYWAILAHGPNVTLSPRKNILIKR